jgi:hypothetical protein
MVLSGSSLALGAIYPNSISQRDQVLEVCASGLNAAALPSIQLKGGGNYSGNQSWEMLLGADGSDTKFYLATYTGNVSYIASWDRTGAMVLRGGLTQNGNPSDIKFKNNLNQLTGATNLIKSITGYEFDWVKERADVEGNIHDYGLIAQDVQKILPHAVKDSHGFLALRYERVIPLLVEAVKELKEENEKLKNRINIIESKLNL